MRCGSFLSRLTALTALVGTVLHLAPANASGAEETLVCHGGGKMNVELWHRGMKVQFSKAQIAADTREPAPGECTGTKRALGESDPAMLSYTSTRLDGVTVQFGADGIITGFHVHGSHGAPAVLYALLDGVRGQKLFRVKATRRNCDGRPCPYFTVTASAN